MYHLGAWHRLTHCRSRCTSKYHSFNQPLDVSVNRPCKHFMRENFEGWYAGEVEKKINARQNTSDTAIEMGIPVMCELTSHWLIDFYQYMQKNPAIMDNGWKKCGITDALANGVPSDDPFTPISDELKLLFTCMTLFVLCTMFCLHNRLPHYV